MTDSPALTGREEATILLRTALTLLLATVLAACVAGPPLTRAAFSPISIQPETQNWELPIIDAHNHLNGDMTGERLVRLMDAARVRRMVLMARYYRGEGDLPGSDEQALAIARQHPGRFLPFVAGQRPELGTQWAWMHPGATGLPKEADSKLRSGEYFGLGEFILRHHAYRTGDGQLGGEVNIPVDTPLMRVMMDLAAKYRAPVLIHAEAEPEVAPAVEAILRYQPNASLIWAHSCGRSSAKAIRELLQRHPSLYCDLGGMTRGGRSGYGNGWPRLTPWVFLIAQPGGTLFDEMRAVYEDFPSRFLLGADVAHSTYLRDYRDRIAEMRLWLDQLSPATARRLAYENAETLFLGTR